MDSKKTIVKLQDDFHSLKSALTFINESTDAVFEQQCDFTKEIKGDFIYGKSLVYEKVNELFAQIDAKLSSLM